MAGGYLLGYANADHWAVAVPLEEALPSWSMLYRDNVPRPALVRGAIDMVAQTLQAQAREAAAAAQPGQPLSRGRAGTP